MGSVSGRARRASPAAQAGTRRATTHEGPHAWRYAPLHMPFGCLYRVPCLAPCTHASQLHVSGHMLQTTLMHGDQARWKPTHVFGEPTHVFGEPTHVFGEPTHVRCPDRTSPGGPRPAPARAQTARPGTAPAQGRQGRGGKTRGGGQRGCSMHAACRACTGCTRHPTSTYMPAIRDVCHPAMQTKRVRIDRCPVVGHMSRTTTHTNMVPPLTTSFCRRSAAVTPGAIFT